MKSNCSSSNTSAPGLARSLSKRIPSGKGSNRILLRNDSTRMHKMGHIRLSWEALTVSCAAAHGRDDTVLPSSKLFSVVNRSRKSFIFPSYSKRWVLIDNVWIFGEATGDSESEQHV